MIMIRAFFDGACGPHNPGGTTSYGAVIYLEDTTHTISELFIPPKNNPRMLSNNVGEYAGLLSVLKYLKNCNFQENEIEICGDSNLVVQQMSGKWKIKKGLYVALALEAKELMKEFTNTNLRWIPREQNTVADKLSKLVQKGGE